MVILRSVRPNYAAPRRAECVCVYLFLRGECRKAAQCGMFGGQIGLFFLNGSCTDDLLVGWEAGRMLRREPLANAIYNYHRTYHIALALCEC